MQNWQRVGAIVKRVGFNKVDAIEVRDYLGLPILSGTYSPCQVATYRDFIYADWAAGQGMGDTWPLLRELEGLIRQKRYYVPINWAYDDVKVWEMWLAHLLRLGWEPDDPAMLYFSNGLSLQHSLNKLCEEAAQELTAA